MKTLMKRGKMPQIGIICYFKNVFKTCLLSDKDKVVGKFQLVEYFKKSYENPFPYNPEV